MNINNFEEYIDKRILSRGYDYYVEGNIIETREGVDGEFIFDVEGSDDYEVYVKLEKNGEIIDSCCDCPYDFGPRCKHEVAAYYELRDFLNKKESKKQKKAKKIGIEEVLSNLAKEELITIILDMTQGNKALKESLIFRYSKVDEDHELESCKKAIDSIVRKYSGSKDYISYRETSYFTYEIMDLFEKVRRVNNPLIAMDMAFLILDESVEAFQYSDDSNGDIGDLVSESLRLIEEIASGIDNKDLALRKKVFEKLLDKCESNVFYGWDSYRIDLLNICTVFDDIEELRNRLKSKIEQLIEVNSTRENKEYSIEQMNHLLLNMIERHGTEEDVEKFLEKNINFTSFREAVINKYVKDRNYGKVIQLAIEGEKQDEEYIGLVFKWKKIRYEAYKALSLKDEQEKLAKELFLNGEFEFYRELKTLIKVDKEVFYNDLKKELELKGKRYLYIKLINEENDLEAIMDYVRKNPNNIEEYAKRLLVNYKEEVIDIYKNYIKVKASYSSNRSHYKEVCGIIKRYEILAGNKNALELVKQFKVLYRKRPAFQDELGKLM